MEQVRVLSSQEMLDQAAQSASTNQGGASSRLIVIAHFLASTIDKPPIEYTAMLRITYKPDAERGALAAIMSTTTSPAPDAKIVYEYVYAPYAQFDPYVFALPTNPSFYKPRGHVDISRIPAGWFAPKIDPAAST